MACLSKGVQRPRTIRHWHLRSASGKKGDHDAQQLTVQLGQRKVQLGQLFALSNYSLFLIILTGIIENN